jgi:cation:H+ antiporter
VGSNLFNLMAVLGLAALVSPEGIAVSAQALAVDLPVMVLVALACLPVVASGHRIDRGEGALLLLGYVGYLSYLLAAARAHP